MFHHFKREWRISENVKARTKTLCQQKNQEHFIKLTDVTIHLQIILFLTKIKNIVLFSQLVIPISIYFYCFGVWPIAKVATCESQPYQYEFDVIFALANVELARFARAVIFLTKSQNLAREKKRLYF